MPDSPRSEAKTPAPRPTDRGTDGRSWVALLAFRPRRARAFGGKPQDGQRPVPWAVPSGVERREGKEPGPSRTVVRKGLPAAGFASSEVSTMASRRSRDSWKLRGQPE